VNKAILTFILLICSSNTVAQGQTRCDVLTLSFSDGSKACMESFEPLKLRSSGPTIVEHARGKTRFAYAIPAQGSKCIPSAGWAWNSATDEQTDKRAVENCENFAQRKAETRREPEFANCRCTALIPASGNVTLSQRDFASQLFRFAYAFMDDLRASSPLVDSAIASAKKDLEEQEQLHYKRLGSASTTIKAKAEEDRHQREAQAKMEEERRQAEALAKADEERKQREATAKAEEDRRQREAQAKMEEERRQAEVLAKADGERKQREATAKAEEDRRQREAQAKMEEERRQAEVLAKADAERKQLEALAKVEAAKKTSQAASQSIRKALVIGNDSYLTVPKLRNARSDAGALSRVLSKLDYSVSSFTDLNERDMKRAIRDFMKTVSGGDEVLFFYAGHGVQIGGENFLLPVDIRAEDARAVRDEAIPLQRVLDDLTEAKVRLTVAIVDACRDNPFAGSGRAIGGRGLSPTNAASGQVIMFSAGSGQQALDRVGPNDQSRNGLFTRVLLKHIVKKSVTIDRVMREVRMEVVQIAKSVGHEQVPALYDQVVGDFYFAR